MRGRNSQPDCRNRCFVGRGNLWPGVGISVHRYPLVFAPGTERSFWKQRLILILLASSAASGTWLPGAAPSIAAVTFRAQSVPNGQRIRQQVHVRTVTNTVFSQSGQVISDERRDVLKEQTRDITVIESDLTKGARARVTYTKATTKDVSRFLNRSVPQPVAGKTYDVARIDATLQVTYPDGRTPPPEEAEIVRADLTAVGKPNPLASFLDSRTVDIGQGLKLPPQVVAELLGQSQGFEHAEGVLLRLRAVREIHGQSCGLFDLEIQGPRDAGDAAKPDELRAPSTIHCLGEIAVAVSTCRTVRAKVDARFSLSEERGPPGATFTVSHRGTAHIEVEARLKPADSGKPWTAGWNRLWRK